MRTCDLDVFSASKRARLATGDGASRMRWRSCAGGVTRVKLLRSTRVLFESISLAITVCQESVVSYHPRFLFVS
jgi:hypothetical protein